MYKYISSKIYTLQLKYKYKYDSQIHIYKCKCDSQIHIISKINAHYNQDIHNRAFQNIPQSYIVRMQSQPFTFWKKEKEKERECNHTHLHLEPNHKCYE